MTLKIPPFIVDSEQPFKDDALERQKLCAELTDKYIRKEISPYVLAIDAAWGNGKTVFLNMWKADLEKRGIRCVFYDAWKSDFYGDALATMIGEISTQIPESQLEELKDAAGKLIKALPRTGLKMVADAFDLGAVTDVMTNSVKQHDAIEDYLNYRKARDDFKDKLKSFAESEDTPLVFFIDELDRCRPDFALEVLEKTKHIFDVESVIFVVALNQTALAQTIEKTYGIKNGESYLQKFFDKGLPLINDSSAVNTATIQSLIPEMSNSSARDYANIVEDFRILFSLSCREQNHLLVEIAELVKLAKNNRLLHIFELLYVFVYALKIAKPNMHEKIVIASKDSEKFPFEETMDLLEPTAMKGNNPAWQLFQFLGACRIDLDPSFKSDIKDKYPEVCQSIQAYYENPFPDMFCSWKEFLQGVLIRILKSE